MITSFDSFFFIFFSTIILSLAILVISLKNTIYSILCLILVFINALNILLLLKIEFFAILLILIYVGAISILFLFVVMMLDIKTDKTSSTDIDLNYMPLSVFIIGVFLIEIFVIFYHIFFYSTPGFFKNLSLLTKSYTNWIQLLDPIMNIQTIGQVLYTHYFIIVLLAGIVLLIGLIGVVQLTLIKKEMKTQHIFQQISRSVNNSYFLIKEKNRE